MWKRDEPTSFADNVCDDPDVIKSIHVLFLLNLEALSNFLFDGLLYFIF